MANGAGPTDVSTAFLIRVDQSGRGDFTKIQDAVDSVPSNNSELVFILVKPGTYRFVLSRLSSDICSKHIFSSYYASVI